MGGHDAGGVFNVLISRGLGGDMCITIECSVHISAGSISTGLQRDYQADMSLLVGHMRDRQIIIPGRQAKGGKPTGGLCVLVLVPGSLLLLAARLRRQQSDDDC